MSFLKSFFGGKKMDSDKGEENKKMAEMIEEIAAQSIVATKWESNTETDKKVTAEQEKAKKSLSEKSFERAEKGVSMRITGNSELKSDNNASDMLSVKPLPVKFENQGVPQEAVAAISAAVAYILDEEKKMAFASNPPAPPIGRKAGKWSFIGRQELMVARQS